MNEFDQTVSEVFTHIDTILKTDKIINNEMLISLYYIIEHIKKKKLSSQNLFLLNKILLELKKSSYKKYFVLDIRYLIFSYMLKLISEPKNKNNNNEFFKAYLVFDNFQNLIENKDFILMLFPPSKLENYIENLFLSFDEINFWEQPIINQKKIIYKIFYVTAIFYERNEKAYKKMFNGFYEKVFFKAMDNKNTELLLFIYTPLQFSWNGVSLTQKEFKFFNEKVELPLEKYIKNNILNKYKLKPNKKVINKSTPIKIAFLQERIIKYSIYDVLYSFIKELNENKNYEIIVLDLNFKELGGSDYKLYQEIKELGITIIDCHNEILKENYPIYSILDKTLKLREMIIDMDIDLLIGMHSRPEYNLLFTSRTCPKQIYWSHGNYEYQLEEIDYYLSHSSNSKNYSKFHVIEIKPILSYYNPNISKYLINEERKNYPKDKFILGSIGRLIKIDNERYLEAVSEIMKKNLNTIYLACGSGDEESIKKKLKKYGIIDRFFFTGQVDPHIYGNIIELYLTPFGAGGAALQEYRYKCRPYVTLYNNEPYMLNKNDINRLIDAYYENIFLELKEKNSLDFSPILYTKKELDLLKDKNYIHNINKFAQTYYEIPFAKNYNEYVRISDILISNSELCEKIGKDFKYKFIENYRSKSTFISFLNKELGI